MSRRKGNDDDRAFSKGSGGANADMATDPKWPLAENRAIESPASRPAKRLEEGRKHDHMAEREAETHDRQEALLDEAIEETFPGSDPIAPKQIT